MSDAKRPEKRERTTPYAVRGEMLLEARLETRFRARPSDVTRPTYKSRCRAAFGTAPMPFVARTREEEGIWNGSMKFFYRRENGNERRFLIDRRAKRVDRLRDRLEAKRHAGLAPVRNEYRAKSTGCNGTVSRIIYKLDSSVYGWLFTWLGNARRAR